MTHKGFDAWLKSNYEGGQPTAVDLQTAQDDEDSIVALSSTIYNLNDGDANLSPAPHRSLSGSLLIPMIRISTYMCIRVHVLTINLFTKFKYNPRLVHNVFSLILICQSFWFTLSVVCARMYLHSLWHRQSK